MILQVSHFVMSGRHILYKDEHKAKKLAFRVAKIKNVL